MRIRCHPLVILGCLIVSLSACGSDVPTSLTSASASASASATACTTTAVNTQTAPDNFNDKVTLGPPAADGLQFGDFKVGTGCTPTAGQTVSVHYTGWLQDGTKFDSSRDRNQAFQFPLGQGQVIVGWDEGVATMHVGGKRRLVVPAPIAYGAAGRPPTIPANATLVFDVELLGVS